MRRHWSSIIRFEERPCRDAGFLEPLPGFKPVSWGDSGGNAHPRVTTGYSPLSLWDNRIQGVSPKPIALWTGPQSIGTQLGPRLLINPVPPIPQR